MQQLTREQLTDVYIALKDLHYFTNFVHSKNVNRKDIEEVAYNYHQKYESTINNFHETLCNS